MLRSLTLASRLLACTAISSICVPLALAHGSASPNVVSTSTTTTATGVTEVATITRSSTTGITATIATTLSGHSFTSSITAPDTSLDKFTGSTTFTTPKGAVVVKAGGSNPYYPSTTKVGQSGVVAGNYTITSSTDSNITTAGGGSYQVFNGVVGLQYASFGVWNLTACSNTASNCNPTYVGTMAGGQGGVAVTAAMPRTGGAAYTGGAVGYLGQPLSTNRNNAAEFYGTTNLLANFSAGTLTGSVSGIKAYSTSTQALLGNINNINLAGAITGTGYTGTATAVAAVAGSPPLAFNITGASGSLTGSFYGPAPIETSGVFYMSGGANSTSLEGSFGAKGTITLPSTVRTVSVTLGGTAAAITATANTA